MYLKYLQIVNYKNLLSERFCFSKGANTIIGENDSGKSNAINALRLLLDDSFFYNTKRLKESDFAYALGDWRGQWIIVSAMFVDIDADDKTTEACSEIIPDKENAAFLSSYIKSKGKDIGVITLFIRPQKSVRKKLSEASDLETFNKIRKNIRLLDYEFYFTSRAQTDFTNPDTYLKIVGDINKGEYTHPDNDDASVLGCKLNITDVQDHISIVFVDALRDVATELRKPRNPIRRIVESIEARIAPECVDRIQDQIGKLNLSISEVTQIRQIGLDINNKLNDMIGMVYSPEIALESQLNGEINSLARYLSIKPSNQTDIDLLGLGHLNIIYMALKLVEYESNRTRELINIMIIEEPEAHIHPHIQKTLFDKLNATTDYTQVIMTTHSTHLSEVSEIRRVNILKSCGNHSKVMHPVNKLNDFGKVNLDLETVSLSRCIERYLDAKRSVLLFSKSILLVEGDGEEILIPAMVKAAFGISLDELGIGLVNIGSTAFEYIACLYHNERIQRHCAVVTDLDAQAVSSKSTHFKPEAEAKGKSRQEKLLKLFGDNEWVTPFFAENTFEVQFASESENHVFLEAIIDTHYVQDAAKKKHKENLKGPIDQQADTVLTLANSIGKGWFATLLASKVDCRVQIPLYILRAIMFACKEILTEDIMHKMVVYSLGEYKATEDIEMLKRAIETTAKADIIEEFCNCYPDDIVSKFLALRAE